jgi:hypothetical protein
MIKRTMGRFLLTVLVVTGLAGTINNTSLNKSERKAAIGLMKDTRVEVLKSVRGLTDKQLNFKASKESWSVKECMYHIAVSEKNLWEMLENAMKTPASPEKRGQITVTDDQVIKMIEDRTHKVKTTDALEPKNSPYKNLGEAIEDFKSMRSAHIKYMKSTTEDLRDHVVNMPFGYIDCYQLCLMIAAHDDRHRQQIDEVKSDAHFPK